MEPIDPEHLNRIALGALNAAASQMDKVPWRGLTEDLRAAGYNCETHIVSDTLHRADPETGQILLRFHVEVLLERKPIAAARPTDDPIGQVLDDARQQSDAFQKAVAVASQAHKAPPEFPPRPGCN